MSAVIPPPASLKAAAATATAKASPWRRRGLLALATLLPWVVLVSLWELAIARGWV